MRDRSRTAFIVAFLSPAVLIYGLFVVWPLIQSFGLAATQMRGVSANRRFVGLDNFKKVWDDDIFRGAVGHNVWMLVFCGAALIALGVALAHAATGKGRTASLVRGIVLIPQAMSLVVVAILWMFLLNPSFGLVDRLLSLVGIGSPEQGLLGASRTALVCVGGAFVWYVLGFYILLFATGLQAIPADLHEAASLDGAQGWRKFRQVTWPLLWSVKRIAVTYLVIHVMNVFTLVYLMTQGGPDRATEVMLTYLYEQAFKNTQFGYATALAVINFVIAMLLSLAVLAWFRRSPEEARA